jgi:membrane-bound lytic murein transglycosylase D
MLHKVKPGETLYQIARDYHATIKQLMEWNEKTDFNLQIGEELRIGK